VTKPSGAWSSLTVKLGLLAVVTQIATVFALLWLADATQDSHVAVRALVFAIALSPPIFIVTLLSRYLLGRLTGPVADAYRQIAAGDFQAELPPMTVGSEFLALREAFAAMGRALDLSVQKLREADLERRRLFADLAHELATPTSTLMGIALALRKGEGDSSRLLDHLEHESARLDRLIADVRELAHLEDPAMQMLCEDCDVATLASRAVERARVARGGVELRCSIVPAPAHVDPLRIDQVLSNVIDNAIRHAPGGTVAVDVHPHGDDVILRVEDSGAGVPEQLLHQLGRRMLRIDPSRSRDTGGHGLGLSIVRAIVTRHGGQISFGRAALGGLAVDVRLPARPSKT
jgi:signal transduction histidine kinase